VRSDGKSKRGSDDRVDIRGKLGTAGRYIEHLTFVAAGVAVERYPGTMVALFSQSSQLQQSPQHPQP